MRGFAEMREHLFSAQPPLFLSLQDSSLIFMSTNPLDPVTRDQNRDIEMRAAVDVFFEALSHIQASLEKTSEDKRMTSYRKFKEALYDRFEYLVEQRTEAVTHDTPRGNRAASAQNGMTVEPSEEADDTLEKLWPAIAKDRE